MPESDGEGAIKIQRTSDDPPKLAEHASSYREAMNHAIRVCRKIGEWVEGLAEMPWDDEASRVAVNQ